MANNTTISIDTVYQRVLALANKEQRGYITPQEFNLHANQAQLDIFEQYFYDLAAHTAVAKRGDQAQQSPTAAPALEPDFGDSINLLREKITIYAGTDTNMVFAGGNFHLPNINNSTIYRTGRMVEQLQGGTRTTKMHLSFITLKIQMDQYHYTKKI